MNKVVHINLGGIPFTIDEEAYEHLSGYLQTLHRHFSQTEGAAEIIADIEARIAELFRESLGTRIIVNRQDVLEAIAVMGRPEDFGAEAGDSQSAHTAEEPLLRTGKRLFRDPDNKIVAGVSSGISAYFGISDPVWVRILFAIFILWGGFGLPLYIILWAVMPEAKTSADRLAMRGEPINVSNLSRVAKEEFEKLSRQMSDMNKTSPGGTPNADRFEAGLRSGVRAATSALGIGLSWVSGFFIGLSRFLVVVILLVFAILWFSMIGSLIYGYPYLSFVFPGQEMLTAMGTFSLLLVVGIPLVGLALGLARLAFGTKVSTKWTFGMGLLWSVSFGMLIISVAKLSDEFRSSARDEMTYPLTSLTQGPVDISTTAFPEEHSGPLFIDNKLAVNKDELQWRNGSLRIYLSSDQQWKLVEKAYARGGSKTDADQALLLTRGKVQTGDNQIEFPGTGIIKRGEKWRAQEVIYELYVPEGAILHFSDEVKEMVTSVDVADNVAYSFNDPGKNTWVMTPLGLEAK